MNAYKRIFITLKQDRGDYTQYGRKAQGRCVLEAQGNGGRASVVVQDLMPDNHYKLYIASPESSGTLCVLLGSVDVDKKGRADSRFTFDADSVGGSHKPLSEFSVAFICVHRANGDVVMPLCGVDGNVGIWKSNLIFFEPSTIKQEEEKPVPLPRKKEPIPVQEPDVEPEPAPKQEPDLEEPQQELEILPEPYLEPGLFPETIETEEILTPTPAFIEEPMPPRFVVPVDGLPVVEPIAEPFVEPIERVPIGEPILEPVVTPIVEPVPEPVFEPIVEPVPKPIVQPIIQPILSPIAFPISEPSMIDEPPFLHEPDFPPFLTPTKPQSKAPQAQRAVETPPESIPGQTHQAFLAMASLYNEEMQAIEELAASETPKVEGDSVWDNEIDTPYYMEAKKDLGIAELFAERPIIHPFTRQKKDVSWVKINHTDLQYIPLNDESVKTSALVEQGAADHKHLILGRYMQDNRERYILGVPDVYRARKATFAHSLGFMQFKCCNGLTPREDAYGYWLYLN